MEREQIIKALECCTIGDCYPCPYGNIGAGCRDKMDGDALTLIFELTEENERLRAEKSELINEFMNWLQDNEHINKSKEYRNELCEMFLNDKRLNK